MRKTTPKNSTKKRSHVIPQTLNSHYRDPRKVNNPQNLPSNHQTQQTSKRGWCTRLFKGKVRMYVAYRRKTRVYTWLLRKNPRICVKNTARLRRRLKNSDPEWTEVVKQWYDKKRNMNESNLRRKTLQTPRNKIHSPVWSPILLWEKSLDGMG